MKKLEKPDTLELQMRSLLSGGVGQQEEFHVDRDFFRIAEHDTVEGLHFEGVATHEGDAVQIELRDMEANITFTCDKCLTQFSSKLIVPFAEVRVPLSNGGADGNFNITDAVRDELNLVRPPVTICKEDCKGLCPECGKDLNTAACSCTKVLQAELGSRPFEHLKDIIT